MWCRVKKKVVDVQDKGAVDVREPGEGNTVGASLHCVLVTYHRIGALTNTISSLVAQTFPPSRIVVVDNGSDYKVREVADRVGASYIDPGENLGPAGGFSLGMKSVLETAQADDWLVTIGDDGPPRTPDRFARLWEFAMRMVDLDARVAAVGSNGARYRRSRGQFVRVPDGELLGPVPVGYLAGSQFHRCSALRAVGPYRPELFFGFEEAEYGLRASSMGWSLYALGEMWLEDRIRRDRLGIVHARSATNTTAWRRYYSARNATVLAREYSNSRVAAIRIAMRSGVGGMISLMKARRPLKEIILPMLGAIHGMRGRLGRTLNPSYADKVTA